MVESTLIRKEKEKEMKFPLLVEAKDSGLIVLFTDNTKGTVLKEDIDYKIGYYSENWENYMRDERWHIFTSGTSITLTVK